MQSRTTIALGAAILIIGICLLFSALSWGDIRTQRHGLENAKSELAHQRYILSFEEKALRDEQASLNQALLKVQLKGQAKNDPRPRLILDSQTKVLVYRDSRQQVMTIPIVSQLTKAAALSITWVPPDGTTEDLQVVELSDGSAMMGAELSARANLDDDILWSAATLNALADHLYVGMPVYVY